MWLCHKLSSLLTLSLNWIQITNTTGFLKRFLLQSSEIKISTFYQKIKGEELQGENCYDQKYSLMPEAPDLGIVGKIKAF